jgi:hypothetical protein
MHEEFGILISLLQRKIALKCLLKIKIYLHTSDFERGCFLILIEK